MMYKVYSYSPACPSLLRLSPDPLKPPLLHFGKYYILLDLIRRFHKYNSPNYHTMAAEVFPKHPQNWNKTQYYDNIKLIINFNVRLKSIHIFVSLPKVNQIVRIQF